MSRRLSVSGPRLAAVCSTHPRSSADNYPGTVRLLDGSVILSRPLALEPRDRRFLKPESQGRQVGGVDAALLTQPGAFSLGGDARLHVGGCRPGRQPS
jgi:hypothetical protein